MSIRILVADDHPLTVSGLKNELGSKPNIEIVGEAKNGIELIELYFEIKPDICILDISMPYLSGIEAAERIIRRDKKARILFCSVTSQKSEIFKTYRIGGKGFISKERNSKELINSVVKVYMGEHYYDPDFTLEDYNEFCLSIENLKIEGKELTQKEIDVLNLIAQNFTNKEIAKKLFVSERTIEQRRRRMRSKLGFKGSNDLIRYAIEFTTNKF